jgi:hypothetical protein
MQQQVEVTKNSVISAASHFPHLKTINLEAGTGKILQFIFGNINPTHF